MKEKVDVSVVIPVYNAKDFLTECVESVVNQKGEDLNIEIILVNDGSTDGSGDICEKLEKQYTNVIFIDKKNSGVSDTRNTGIKRAQGKYILMLDSDDYLGDTTVSKLFEFFEEHYDAICDDLWYINADESVRRERLRVSRGYSQEKIDGIFANQMTEEFFRTHCDYEIENNGDLAVTCRQIEERIHSYETL